MSFYRPPPSYVIKTEASLEQLKLFGIYAIKNIKNGRIYVGHASYFRARLTGHSRDLKNKKHVNPILQNSYNKHKGKDFKFEILEFCDNREKSFLKIREQFWIDKYRRKEKKEKKIILYNIHKQAVDSPLGVKRSREVIENMRMRFSRDWVAVSPKKEIINIRNLFGFCRGMGIHRPRMKLKNGTKIRSKGWLFYRKEDFSMAKLKRDYREVDYAFGCTQNWVVISPTKEKFVVFNLEAFCKNYPELNVACLRNVANEKQPHTRGWLCYFKKRYNSKKMEKDYNKINEIKYVLMSPTKQIYYLKDRELFNFCRKNKISRNNVTSLFAERIKVCSGWVGCYYKNYDKDKLHKTHNEYYKLKYKLIHKNGETIKLRTLWKFCKQNGINQTNITKYGKFKDWTLEYIKD